MNYSTDISFLNEGIDFDVDTKTVSYNPSHENNVDTSLENNPTVDDEILSGIKVWSIFKRKIGNSRNDGNPLLYALKNEGWKFKSEKDKKAVFNQFEKIIEKFVNIYPVGITVLVPSGNQLNRIIADTIIDKCDSAEVIEGLIRKLTTEEIEEIVLDFKSKFRTVYKDNFSEAFYQLCDYLDLMDRLRDGYFTRHLIKDPKMRNTVDNTLKISNDLFARFANKINGQNILIVDDSISRGQTIKEVVAIIKQCYSPKSITILTLFSKLS